MTKKSLIFRKENLSEFKVKVALKGDIMSENLNEFENEEKSIAPVSYFESVPYEDKTEESLPEQMKEAEEAKAEETKSKDADDAFKNILTKSGKPKTKLFSALSLIFGITSVIVSFFTMWGILVAAVSVCFSLLARKMLGYFDPLSIAGLSLGAVGVVIPIALVLLAPLIKALYS